MTPRAEGYLEAKRSVLDAIDFVLERHRRNKADPTVKEAFVGEFDVRIDELERVRLYVKKMVAKNE